jgi:hypothetical protein
MGNKCEWRILSNVEESDDFLKHNPLIFLEVLRKTPKISANVNYLWSQIQIRRLLIPKQDAKSQNVKYEFLSLNLRSTPS